MKYYKIMFDDERIKKDDIVCFTEKEYERRYGVKQYDLNDGKFIDNWSDIFTFYYNEKDGNQPTDYISNNLGWFLVSHRFQQIMKSFREEQIQYLPVNIKETNTGKVLNEFL
ncbi:DUF1629 domain-containing protein [Clostridium sp. CX1]|uniref:DUF1629 domain-containing protein n=1 Tax=Clostridium tanneri TaxID=3037988 RepID=A0ABU4JZ41_9CLOT|nr:MULTISPECIES: DUF1629 domain-containing protein [unclassified Clostridium]MCT8978827.1 DUF1629 domain-containing protein [Clostridium sp. CX1]MDW8803189.1 DUF1629 domain-containing protein [Clostridium sp. A1-XYC3]